MAWFGGCLRRSGFEIVHVNEPHALMAAFAARAHRRSAMVIARRVAFPIPRRLRSHR